MSDKPMLFSGPMVRALLREIEKPGTGKTQTRRVLAKVPVGYGYSHSYSKPDGVPQMSFQIPWRPHVPTHTVSFPEPYAPGDRIWVRETWRTHAQFDHLKPSDITARSIHYDANGTVRSGKVRQSIFMPRWASRITLLVDDVRVQRVQDISEDDAMAEGLEREPSPLGISTWFALGDVKYSTAKPAFRALWNSLNAKHGWDANPWVVALTFRPVLKNIDQLEAREAVTA